MTTLQWGIEKINNSEELREINNDEELGKSITMRNWENQ